MKQAYTEPPKISIAKKQDLLSLCHSNLIPEQYHEFYDKLSTENKESTRPKSSSQIKSNIKKVAPAKKKYYKKHYKKKIILRFLNFYLISISLSIIIINV